MKNNKKYTIAIDVGGTKTNIGYFNKGKLIKTINFKTKKFGPDNVDVIKSILQKSRKEIKIICLSLTGLINKGLWNPINKKTLGNFNNYPIIKNLKSFFRVPIYALGDTQAAALGELFFGNGKKLNNFFYLTISTGIGGSIIQRKKLFEGKESDVGSIGHNIIRFNGKLCGCGRKGCLEAYASGDALIKENKIKKCKNTKELLTKFKDNVQTVKIVDKAVEMIIESMINLNNILRINYFIVGGSIGLNSFFFKKIKFGINKNKYPIKIIKSKLYSKAELYGCYAYVKNKLYLIK